MTIKQKIFVICLALTIILALTLGGGQHIFDPIFVSLFIALIMYVGIYWVVNFDTNTMSFVTVFAPAALLAFATSYVAQTGFSLFSPGSTLYLIVACALFFFFIYISSLTANIINTWTFKNVALAQVAVTVFLLLSLVSFYFASFALISFKSLPIVVLGALVVGWFLAFCNIWLSGVKTVDSLKLSTLIACIVLFFSFVLFFWPIPTEMYAAVLASVYFVSSGVLTHAKKNTLNVWVWLEYLLILAIALGFLITTARWGIGGSI